MNNRFPVLLFKFLWINTYVSGGVVTLVLASVIEGSLGIFIAIALGGWCLIGGIHWRRLYRIGSEKGSDFLWVTDHSQNDESKGTHIEIE